jgi:hypothetical protein
MCHFATRVTVMHIPRFLVAVVALLLLVGCGRKEVSPPMPLPPGTPGPVPETPAPKAPTTHAPPKVGGIYANKYSDGTYQLVKVLAVDDQAVHVRVFTEKPTALPQTIDSSKLEVMVGHAPVLREIFDQEDSTLLKVEEVAEAELEGYRVYLETTRGK